MISRSESLSRTLVGLIAAAAALLAFAPGALAADVTIVSTNGQSKTFDLGALAGEFDVSADYEVRSTRGVTTQRVNGISIRRLIELADADPVYRNVDIGSVRMTRTQIEGAGAVPAIYPTGGQAGFIRTSYGPGDRNAGDLFSTGSITIKQAQVSTDDGPIATAEASKRTVKAKQPVSFKASVSNAAAGEQFTYQWSFNDGSTASGESVKHSFKKRGTYRVLLTVKSAGSPSSIPAAVLMVQVGAPVKSKKKRTGTGTNDSAGAPLTGASDGDAGSGEQADTGAAKKPKKKKQREPEPKPGEELEVVSGELMSAAAPIAAPSTLAARSGQPGITLSNGFTLSGPAIAALLAVLLLLAGLMRESVVLQQARRRLRGMQ